MHASVFACQLSTQGTFPLVTEQGAMQVAARSGFAADLVEFSGALGTPLRCLPITVAHAAVAVETNVAAAVTGATLLRRCGDPVV